MTKHSEPAQIRRYLYHITPRSNLESIAQNGLIVNNKINKFGPMSPQANDKKPKIFLLPSFNHINIQSWLVEWWHNDSDVVIIRMGFNDIIDPRQSTNNYYARKEVWTYYHIKNKNIFVSEIDCLSWKKLLDR